MAPIAERSGENTTELVLRIFRRMGIFLKRSDISRSHRQSKGRNNRGPRPIYVKFVSHDLKDEIFLNRDRLRELPEYRGVFINENLTLFRSRLYQIVRRECGRQMEHYTYDGVIYVRKVGDSKSCHAIVDRGDFEKVFKKSAPI